MMPPALSLGYYAPRATPPAPFVPSDSIANINAAVLGLYGGLTEDPGIGRTIEPTAAKMKQLRKTFEPHIFEGAAHGFLRAQTGNNGANMKATEQARPLTVAWIRKHASQKLPLEKRLTSGIPKLY